MRTEQITYMSADDATRLSGYVAAPKGPGPYRPVLILRGVAGPADGYVEIANRVADWGCLAFVHGWKIRGDDPPDRPIMQDLAGAIKYLHGRDDADMNMLAVFGFCRGGVHALMAADAHREIRLVVVFHGFAFRPEQAQPGLQPFDLVRNIHVPTLIMHGTEDEQAPIEGMRLLEAAQDSDKAISFKYYDGIRHGFAVRTHPGYDKVASEDSFKQAHDFMFNTMKR